MQIKDMISFRLLHKQTCPDGFATDFTYTGKGYLEEIIKHANHNNIFSAYTHNLYGQPTKCGYGNATATIYEYNEAGLLTRMFTGLKHYGMIPPIPHDTLFSLSFPADLDDVDDMDVLIEEPFTIDSTIQNFRYTYDNMGRLVQRSQKNSQYEAFTYDNLDRLTSFTQGTIGGATQTFPTTYDLQGNILSNALAGTYRYDGNKPHAVTSVTPSSGFPDAISSAQCETEYNCLGQPSRIAEGNVEILLEYGADGQRTKAEFKTNGHVVRTHYYISANYEKEIDSRGAVTHYHYIYGANGLAAVCMRRGSTDKLFYVHPDRLGSYTHITDENKQVLRALHFDPWGNVKTDTNWTVFAENAPSSLYLSYRFDRGFTGHEHYADLKIINMNGRLYDPVIARFFSPDNFVQVPDFTQSYNRYSYCLNNPLQYVDPSGESFLAAAFAIGALTNVFFQMISGNINSAGDFLFYAGIGGFAGMTGAAAGSAAASAVGVGGFLGGAASGAASGAVGGFIAGTGNALVGGNDFATALGYGWLGGVGGALFGGLSGGLASGITDAIHGNNFWDGSFFEEFATGVVVPDDDYVAIANHYNNGNLAGEYDNMLVDRYQKMFGVKPGDFNINEITTRTTDCLSLNENYGMNIDFQYVKISEKRIVGGYVIGNSQSGTIIHISPATTCQDEVIFRALAGHKLTHAYHHYILPNFTYTWNKIYSERAAYQYSFNVYTRYGYLHKAISTMAIARSLNYWGAYSEIYASPFF